MEGQSLVDLSAAYSVHCKNSIDTIKQANADGATTPSLPMLDPPPYSGTATDEGDTFRIMS